MGSNPTGPAFLFVFFLDVEMGVCLAQLLLGVGGFVVFGVRVCLHVV